MISFLQIESWRYVYKICILYKVNDNLINPDIEKEEIGIMIHNGEETNKEFVFPRLKQIFKSIYLKSIPT